VKVTAKVTRSGDWWAVEVPEVPGVFTQAKRLDQVEEMVRDAVALMIDARPAGIDVDLVPVLPHDVEDDLRKARELANQAAILQEEASAATRRVVLELREIERLSVRDVGKLLKLSPQRVSQLAVHKGAKSDTPQGNARGKKARGARVKS
jgi:predicted RNase H-like HicB family nuclease